MKMVGYRETAMRHGEKWLKSRERGVRQYLRKGKGDAPELEAKLAILLEVKEQRMELVQRARETLEGLESRKGQLMRKKDAIERQIADLMVEVKMAEIKLSRLDRISKDGLAISRHERNFWEKQLV